MSDPAIEAALRACSYPIDDQKINHTGSCLKAAAREALQPIRELHRRIQRTTTFGICSTCNGPSGRATVWPCDTAKLVYSTEELASE